MVAASGRRRGAQQVRRVRRCGGKGFGVTLLLMGICHRRIAPLVFSGFGEARGAVPQVWPNHAFKRDPPVRAFFLASVGAAGPLTWSC
jgi:hypothetical protein